MQISVIIPTHKQKVLEKTLQALTNQNWLTRSQYEVIVVNNPFEQNTKDLAEKYGVKYIISELGSNNARNAGIQLAQSKLIALTDDDCEPDTNWLHRLVSLHNIYKDAGVICGPLKLKYLCEQPKWLTDDLEMLLSKFEWPNPINIAGPFDLNIYPRRWVVSANLSFTKARYEEVGGLNGNIGYHGKNQYIGNDEIQFAERLNKLGTPGILYDNDLVVNHLITEDRCNIDYLTKRSYGQAYADILMYKEEHQESENDIYHNFIQPKMLEILNYGSILQTRLKIANEDITREYIKVLLKVKLAYLIGLENGMDSQWIKQL